jgi:hypothetical protein
MNGGPIRFMVLRALPNEVIHRLAHLSNEELVTRMISISPMSTAFEDRFRKSKITGFMLESFTESVLSSIEIEGGKFSLVEVNLLLNYQRKLYEEEAEEDKKRQRIEAEEDKKRQRIEAEEDKKRQRIVAEEDKKLQRSAYLVEKMERSRKVMITEITPGANASQFALTFTSEAGFANFLKERKLLSLARMNEMGIREEIQDFFLLENNDAYFTVPKIAGDDFDIEKEVREMLNLIRTKADYSTKRNIEDYYRVNLTFKGNDIKIKDSSGAVAGDVDSLFVSDHIHFLVERKRTIGSFDKIYDQIVGTQKAYKTFVLDVAGIECKLVSIL